MAEYKIKRKLYSCRKPLKVSLKRKTKSFGLGDGLGSAVNNVASGAVDVTKNITGAAVDTTKQVAGGAMDAVGKVAQSGAAGLIGRIGGAMAGSALGPLGTVAGFLLGGKATKAAGKALSNAGQNIQMS